MDATSGVHYLDVGGLFNVYDCFKMQISNKGCGVIFSLLNGHFWYSSAFASVPGMYLTKEPRSDLSSFARQLYPTSSPSLGAAHLQGPVLHFEMRTIVWICDIKKSSFTQNILYSFWHRSVSMR